MILSGSPEELPLPEGATRGILPGQTIVCEVENLGRLENLIAEQPYRQPHEP
jgi:2-keto-4-pentenoate hydratase/2-oxohepta-3-ene-1,7-dioic acid hydratase in catechol pathway